MPLLSILCWVLLISFELNNRPNHFEWECFGCFLLLWAISVGGEDAILVREKARKSFSDCENIVADKSWPRPGIWFAFQHRIFCAFSVLSDQMAEGHNVPFVFWPDWMQILSPIHYFCRDISDELTSVPQTNERLFWGIHCFIYAVIVTWKKRVVSCHSESMPDRCIEYNDRHYAVVWFS